MSPSVQAKLRKRQRLDKLIQNGARASVGLALTFLLGLIAIVFLSGLNAFIRYEVKLDAEVLANTPHIENLIEGPIDDGRAQLSDRAQNYFKASLAAGLFKSNSIIQDVDILQRWQAEGRISRHLDLSVLREPDSQSARKAGIAGALVGTLMILFVAAGLAFPLGIGTALYLSEFAPQDRMTRWLIVNIGNLAAIPPILFGVLGLAVLIGAFGFARAVPLVAGLVLALRIFPTVVIASRAALDSAPQDVVEGALALGASPMQAVLRQKLRLASPGIFTGCLLAISQAISETAPLLLIGMVAFVTRVPDDLSDPASALPVQIYSWATRLEPSWVERASVAVLVLLFVILLINGLAVFIRARGQAAQNQI